MTSAHDAGDAQEEIAVLRAEVAELKKLVAKKVQTQAFYTEEINEALAVWLGNKRNLNILARALRDQAPKQDL